MVEPHHRLRLLDVRRSNAAVKNLRNLSGSTNLEVYQMNATAISDLAVREVLDSRGNPTIEVTVRPRGRLQRPLSAVPSDASTGDGHRRCS